MGVINMFDRAAVWGGNNVFEPVSGDGIALISQSGYVAYSITNVEEAFGVVSPARSANHSSS